MPGGATTATIRAPTATKEHRHGPPVPRRAGPVVKFPAVTRRSAETDDRSTVVLTWGVATLAWLALGLGVIGHGGAAHTGTVEQLDGTIGMPPAAGWPQLGVLIAWLLMVLAMMVPLSARLLVAVRRLVARRRHPGALVAVSAIGLVVPWLVVGQLLMSVDLLVQAGLARLDWFAGRHGAAVSVAMIGAGAVQFSGLKQRCLIACRTPLGFAARYWSGRRPAVEALRIGFAYGLSCVGCCWALMAVMVVLGMAAWAPMLVLAAVMAVERWAGWGVEFSRWVGTGFVGGGLVALALSI